MAIQFNQIPLGTHVPGVYLEIDGSRAGTGVAIQPHESLLIGQKLTSGTATENVIYPIRSAGAAIGLFGQHSQLAQMCAAYKGKDKLTPLWAVAMDDEAGTQATGDFTFSGTATAAGELAFYVAGRRITIAVSVGDAAADIEAAAVAAINADPDCPVSAAAGAGTSADLTARHFGTIGNQILLGVALRNGETVPAGLTVTPNAMSGGATDPDHDSIVNAMGDDQYHTVVAGIRTGSEIAKLVTEMESRFDAPRMIEGVLFTAAQDSQADLTTLGNGYNSPVLVVVGYEENALCQLPWEVAAQVAAINARRVQSHPAVAGTGDQLEATYSAPPRGNSRFSDFPERNTLLTDGIATLGAGSDGRQVIQRLVTTYQTNALGIADTAFRDLYKVRTLSYLRYTWRTRMATKFANALLGDDGSESSGALVVTPSVMRAECLAWYLDMADLAVVEGGAYDQFAEELVVERNAGDDNRLDALLPPDLINNLLVTAAKMSFLG